jgi:hypothetical protein
MTETFQNIKYFVFLACVLRWTKWVRGCFRVNVPYIDRTFPMSNYIKISKIRHHCSWQWLYITHFTYFVQVFFHWYICCLSSVSSQQVALGCLYWFKIIMNFFIYVVVFCLELLPAFIVCLVLYFYWFIFGYCCTWLWWYCYSLWHVRFGISYGWFDVVDVSGPTCGCLDFLTVGSEEERSFFGNVVFLVC